MYDIFVPSLVNVAIFKANKSVRSIIRILTLIQVLKSGLIYLQIFSFSIFILTFLTQSFDNR